MSCADVCLSHDYDGTNEFYAEKWVTARKPRECCECRAAIGPGERYQRAAGKADGDFFVVATCEVCADVRAAFVCGSWVFGQLWESVREEMFPVWKRLGPYDCLAKLTRQSAVDECMREFEEWCGDSEVA